MDRRTYDGFSLVVPEGWVELLEEEGTFSDTTEQLPPVRLGAPRGGAGMMFVSAQGMDDPDAEALALDWGTRRGLGAPLSFECRPFHDATLATAVYQLRGEFVRLWYFAQEATVIHASYVCPWDARDDERATREALIASLRFG
jgi:hypothetical protein